MSALLRERSVYLLSGILILLFVVAMFRPGNHYPGYENKYQHQQFWIQKVNQKEKYNILFLGSSRVYRNIDPSHVEHSIGQDLRSYNYGFSAGGLNPEIYREAELLLVASPATRVIVLGVDFTTLSKISHSNEELAHYRSFSKWDKFKTLYVSDILHPFRPIYYEDLLPESMGQYKREAYVSNHYHENGWVASNAKELRSERYIKDLIKGYELTEGLNVSSLALHQLCEQVKKWSDEGVIVIAFNPPQPMRLIAKQQEFLGFDENVIRELVIEHGGYWMHIDHNAWETYDASHLPKDQAIIFSQELGEEIGRIIQKREAE